MLGKNPFFTLALAGFSLLLSVQVSRADAIDGQWCSASGRRIAIEGSAGVAPKGARITGQYTRHSFAFVMPNGEADAGAPVDMLLQGERRVRIRIGLGEPETWQRCPPDIS